MSFADLSRRLDKIGATLVTPKSVYAERYRSNAALYVREILGVEHITPDQRAVLDFVSTHRRVRLLVPSGNETGKSFVAACILSWHYDCFRPSITITTAPAKKQIDDIVFRELRMMRRGDPGFSPKASNLSDGPDHVCYGYTAKDENSFHGRHAGNVCLVFDEAEGIDGEFWEAAESFADVWVCFYNPTKAGSAASIAERSGRWKIITMSVLNHPNIKCGELGLPPLIPNAVTLDKAIGRIEEYRSVLITDPNEPWESNDIKIAGRRYRLSPVAEARILGRRPSRSTDAVYATSDIELLRTRAKPTELKSHWPVRIGCDVARFGDDFTVFHVRQGPCSIHHESHNGWDTKQTERRLRELAVRFAPLQVGAIPQDIPILIDAIGLGAGLVDHAEGFNFIGINTSRSPDEGKEIDYPNLRSQIAFDLEDLIAHGYVDLSRLDDAQIHDICEQLSVMTYELGVRGQRVVHPKKILKERLGRSPDDADAILLAYYQFPETIEVHRK